MLNDVKLFSPAVRITICTIGCIDELAQVVIILHLTRQGHGENSTYLHLRYLRRVALFLTC